jgi:hypothetical protein
VPYYFAIGLRDIDGMADYCEITQIIMRAIAKAFNDGIVAKELVIAAVS